MYEYTARVAYIYDADTLRLDVDLGFHTWLHYLPFRLHGVDAPELGTPGGVAARDWLRNRLPVGAFVVAATHRDKADKYGRWLVDLFDPTDMGASINRALVDAGHAVPYTGGAR